MQRLEHEIRVRKAMEMRVRIKRKAEKSKVDRLKAIELCRRDPIFFINHFGWTYDDRVGEEEPMVLYPFQEKKIVAPYLDMLATRGRERYTGCVEKSRGVGYTWGELFCRLWSWLFKPNHSILIGAVHVLDVDDGGQEATHESLFGKLRFMIDHLPKWMRDELLGPWIAKDSFNKRLLLKNPLKPRNIIVGKQFGSMFGRGHRYGEVFGDEIAHAEEMKNADTSLKQTTNRFRGGSTPNGKHTFHYQLMKGPLRVRRETMHWSEHPELDVDWYNEQRQEMTDEAIAQELDIDYESSAGHRVLPEVKTATHFWMPKPEEQWDNSVDDNGNPCWDGTIYEPSLPLHAMIDPGISDALACIWVQPDRGRDQWRVVDFVQTNDRAIDWIVPFLIGSIPEETYRFERWHHEYNDIELEIIERHNRWRGLAELFGDSYGSTRSMNDAQSAYDVLSRYNLWVCPVDIKSDIQAISHLQLWMRHVIISGHLIDQRNGPEHLVPTFEEVTSQWRYKKREEGKGTLNLRPVHDKYCHGGDCLKMYADQSVLPKAAVQPVAAGRSHRERGTGLSVTRKYRPRR